MPRWLWSVRALRKGAVLARGVSFDASRGSLLMRSWPLGLGGKGQNAKWNKLAHLCAACVSVSADCAIEVWNCERDCEVINKRMHQDQTFVELDLGNITEPER